MDQNTLLPLVLGLAWLLPLASFVVIVLWGPRLGRHGEASGHVATGAIVLSFLLSAVALGYWLWNHPLAAAGEHAAPAAPVVGEWYTLAQFGALRVTIGYYIDALTVAMFTMVSLVASCIHVYSFGYMHEELHEVTDPLVTLPDGQPLRRAGRFPRFFQYMSLFCFSMLGLAVAGNVAMVFVFWELVGICSYLLIGFYVERQSACNAGNKAFIVNRVGDFGMLVGMAALWASLGTFTFGDLPAAPASPASAGSTIPGIFSMVRSASNDHALAVPDGMTRLASRDKIEEIYRTTPSLAAARAETEATIARGQERHAGYWLLVVAGLGIFCGCVGKSAQFPLHVWLPDAMEGPTPVSALIHAATMVAAGVYLVGRFYPVFTPEVLLVIAYVGCITLFIAATIAITATDIKRVLAYSTVSQLGYMMLALGVGGWAAGLFHLFTHAFFKALLFLCAGSVIHACGTNEMPQMGGLLKKMPWTAWTMLAGCLAISGAWVPGLLGLSGYYSKDAILAQLAVFQKGAVPHAWLFYVAMAGAALTSFYMFRLWYMTFAGRPRDKHVYEHAHESPKVMYIPLVVLAVLAVVSGWRVWPTSLSVTNLLEQARPLGTAEGISRGVWWPEVVMPAEHLSHAEAVHTPVSYMAFAMAMTGFVLATLFYGVRTLDAEDARRQFASVYRFVRAKWWFDELYDAVFVRPVLAVSRAVAAVDRGGIDWLADHLAFWCRSTANFDDLIDRLFVDGAVNGIARWTYRAGLRLRAVQTGRLRQYVMWIAVGIVGLFVLVSWYWSGS